MQLSSKQSYLSCSRELGTAILASKIFGHKILYIRYCLNRVLAQVFEGNLYQNGNYNTKKKGENVVKHIRASTLHSKESFVSVS